MIFLIKNFLYFKTYLLLKTAVLLSSAYFFYFLLTKIILYIKFKSVKLYIFFIFRLKIILWLLLLAPLGLNLFNFVFNVSNFILVEIKFDNTSHILKNFFYIDNTLLSEDNNSFLFLEDYTFCRSNNTNNNNTNSNEMISQSNVNINPRRLHRFHAEIIEAAQQPIPRIVPSPLYLEAIPVFPDPEMLFTFNNGSLNPNRIGGEVLLNNTPFGGMLLQEYFNCLQTNNISLSDAPQYLDEYMEQAYTNLINSDYYPHRSLVREEIRWSVYGSLKLQYVLSNQLDYPLLEIH
jgi:hypothetical protein